MPTRRQSSETREFRQDAFASAAENNRGILANLVAARCHKLTDREEIALIWWLQQCSWREGGMEQFSREFLAVNRAQIGTPAMLKIGTRPGRIYTADQVRAVRDELPLGMDVFFPLKGERLPRPPEGTGLADYLDEVFSPNKWVSEEEAASRPESYSAADFVDVCLPNITEFAEALQRALVKPGDNTLREGVRFFPGLWQALRAWRQREIDAARTGILATAVTRQVAEELDFTRETRSFVLIEGREGIGKSQAAQAWCAQHPGEAVYVRLEPGSDETTLYRSIALQIGTACSYARTAVDIRVRIQDALQSGHVMLVLDEAHFLWPQSARSERTVPKRLDWLRTAIVDFSVPVALVSTPQFFQLQCDRFRRAGWNANQIQRRLTRTAQLPDSLGLEDMEAVSRSYFPAVSRPTLVRIGAFALTTVGYLTTIAHIRKRVDFWSARSPGSSEATLIQAALSEIAATPGALLPTASKACATALPQSRTAAPKDFPVSETAPGNRLVQLIPQPVTSDI